MISCLHLQHSVVRCMDDLTFYQCQTGVTNRQKPSFATEHCRHTKCCSDLALCLELLPSMLLFGIPQGSAGDSWHIGEKQRNNK